jgi:hypothetical protein
MRALLFAVPLMLASSPALAQMAPPRPAPQIPPQIDRALTDPAMADTLGRVSAVLAKSLLDLPIGEVEAAIEGRPATPADRARRVRDQVNDPYIEQRIAANAAQSGRMMQSAGRAVVASLPALMGALGQVERELERAIANIPDPTYPRR